MLEQFRSLNTFAAEKVVGLQRRKSRRGAYASSPVRLLGSCRYVTPEKISYSLESHHSGAYAPLCWFERNCLTRAIRVMAESRAVTEGRTPEAFVHV